MLHGPNLGIVFVSVLVLCPLVLGLLHWCTARGFFVMHGPNLGGLCCNR